jgi:hypothetical protein
MMFKYLRKKLGIEQLISELSQLRSSVPALDTRNRQTLTAVESLLNVLETPCADDSQIIHHLRCMGYCGGWKVTKERPQND